MPISLLYQAEVDAKLLHVAWKKLLSWMTRSRLEPVVKVARTIRQYLWGIANATRLGATNAKSESANAMIQKLKACL